MFGWKGELTPDQTAQDRGRQAGLSMTVFKAAGRRRAEGESGHPGRRAVRRRHPSGRGGGRICDRLPAEKSGQEEFDFEYGEDFAHPYEAFTRLSARCWCDTTR
jgi:hypothetical protein